jgi:hypothetical protein
MHWSCIGHALVMQLGRVQPRLAGARVSGQANAMVHVGGMSGAVMDAGLAAETCGTREEADFDFDFDFGCACALLPSSHQHSQNPSKFLKDFSNFLAAVFTLNISNAAHLLLQHGPKGLWWDHVSCTLGST